MTQNPEAQTEAQKELDNALGPMALPTFEDKERLPYVRNLIREVMRLYPVIPSGMKTRTKSVTSIIGVHLRFNIRSPPRLL